MKQLNNVILKDIFIYLSLNCNFSIILEYSLISKSCFKLFQNIISTKGDIIDVILPIKTLYQYIQSCDNDNNHLKLLQLDKVEYIKSCRKSKKSYERIQSIQSSIYQDQEERILVLDNNFKIKQYFTMKCKNLKTIHWVDKFKLSENTDFTKDQSLGFFKFDSLSIFWNSKFKPISNEIEKQDLMISNLNHSDYEYSFNFLEYYNRDDYQVGSLIKKLIISTNEIKKHQLTLPVYKLDGIINNCSSIESIKFIDHPTPPSFLNQLLSNSKTRYSLKSLSIGLNETFDKDSSTDIMSIDLEERDNFLNNLFSTNENQLKKLIISGIRVADVKRFIQSIVNGNKNKTLETIGLFNGNISRPFNNVDYFKPLYQLPFLSTLVFSISTISLFLQFTKEFNESFSNGNGGIKHLKIVFGYPMGMMKSNSEVFIQKLSEFYDNGNKIKNLSTITIIDPIRTINSRKEIIVYLKSIGLKLFYKAGNIY